MRIIGEHPSPGEGALLYSIRYVDVQTEQRTLALTGL